MGLSDTCLTYIYQVQIDIIIYQIYQFVGGFSATFVRSHISQNIFFHMIGNKLRASISFFERGAFPKLVFTFNMDRPTCSLKTHLINIAYRHCIICIIIIIIIIIIITILSLLFFISYYYHHHYYYCYQSYYYDYYYHHYH